MKTVCAAVLLAPLVIAGCATRASVDRARADIAAFGKDMEELRQAQDKSAREVANVVAELRAGRDRLSALTPQMTENTDAIRKFAKRVDEAEAAVARMRATAEATAVREPPRVLPAAAPAPGRVRLPEPAAHLNAPEQAYAAALEVFQAREYGQAVLDFLDFIAKYPKHQLASNAQYWIGEAYYVQRDYRQAALEFQKVIDGDARGTKTPDALLKIGLCYVSLHQPTRAQQLWEQVVREYPDSEAARKARTLIRGRGVSSRRSR